VESLARLTGRARTAAWIPKAQGGYSPRFMLGTAEVAALAGELRHGEVAAGARAEIEATFVDGEWAAAFVRDAARAIPAPIVLWGSAPSRAAALARLARWAVSALDLAETFGADDPFVAVTLPRSQGAAAETVVAFAVGSAVVAGRSGAHGPARILNRRARRRQTQE
jgi:hypothetical protein